MADNEHEIPVLVTVKPDSQGSIWGVSKFAGIFGKLKTTILTNPWIISAIAVYKFVSGSASAWRRQESAVNSLNQALINQGIYTRDRSLAYQDLATAIQQDTTYGDEEILEAMASMQPLIGDIQISRRLMMSVVDFATRNRMDLSTAAFAVGRAIGDGADSLKRYGIELADNSTKSERLAQVVSGLERISKGQAEAHAMGTGAINKMMVVMNSLSERFGKSLSPFIIAVVNQISKSAIQLQQSEKFGATLIEAFDYISLTPEILKATLSAIADSIPVVLQTGFKAFTSTITKNHNRANAELKYGYKQISTIILTNKEKFYADRDLLIRERREIASKVRSRNSLEYKNLVEKQSDEMQSGKKGVDQFLNTRSEKEAYSDIAYQRLSTNKKYLELSHQFHAEKDVTRRLEYELDRKKMFEAEFEQVQIKAEHTKFFFAEILDKEKIGQEKNALQALSELKNSKFGPQVLIGKVATIAMIGVNTAESIAFTWQSLAPIAPPIGPIIAMAVNAFLAWWGAEQINNIVASDINHPGKIGFGDFTWEDFLKDILFGLGGLLAGLVRGITGAVNAILDVGADISNQIHDAITGFFKDTLGLGEVGGFLTASIQIIGDIIGVILDVVGDVIAFIGGIIADAIGWIGGAIEDALDFLFGWLFAEGGVVTHHGGAASVVPLKKSGLNFRQTLNVTIMGGLNPTRQEAKRIANLIHGQMRMGNG